MKKYMILIFGIASLCSCATRLTFDDNSYDLLLMTDIEVMPSYILPGTYIPLIQQQYSSSTTYNSSGTSPHGGAPETVTTTKSNDFPVSEIGLRINNLLCLDEFGNLLLDITGLVSAEDYHTFAIRNGRVNYQRQGDIINVTGLNGLIKKKTYQLDEEHLYQLTGRGSRPVVMQTEKGLEHYDYGVLGGANINRLEFVEPGIVKLDNSVATNLEGYQESSDQAILKQRFFLNSRKFHFKRIGIDELLIEIDEGLLSRTKSFTLKLNGSELLFTNKKGEGVHIVLRDKTISIERTVDAFLGNRVIVSEMTMSY